MYISLEASQSKKLSRMECRSWPKLWIVNESVTRNTIYKASKLKN